jgi:hypothetical protein
VVGIVLRSLEDLERVLVVVREVAILKPLPLRVLSLFTDTAYYPPFNFTTSVHSFEVCAAYSRVFPFNTEVYTMFAEVAIKSEGGNGGRKILPPPSLPIEPPSPTPNPQLPPIIPSPSPSPSPSPPPDGGDGRLVTWNVKFFALPSGTTDYMYLKYLIAVSRDDGTSISRHYEERQSAPFVLSPEDSGAGIEVSTVVVSVSVTKTSLSKTWNVKALGTMSGTIYVNENVSVTAPPFNGQSEPNIPWIDTQIHTV